MVPEEVEEAGVVAEEGEVRDSFRNRSSFLQHSFSAPQEAEVDLPPGVAVVASGVGVVEVVGVALEVGVALGEGVAGEEAEGSEVEDKLSFVDLQVFIMHNHVQEVMESPFDGEVVYIHVLVSFPGLPG